MRTYCLPASFLNRMATALRTLAHVQRLKVIEFLDRHGPAPVFRIQKTVGGAQGALSQHLNKMRHAGLLTSERHGKEVWYAIANPDALTILNCMRKHYKRGVS